MICRHMITMLILINFKCDGCITMLLWSDTIDVDGDEEEDMIMYLPHKMLMFRSITK